MARHASDLELLRFEESFDGEIRLDEPLSKHTSYRIGGPARAYILVNSPAALSAALAACKADECLWVVVGKGSNLLVSDAGFKGAVIALAGEFRNWKFDEENARVVVGAGTTLSRLVQEVFHRGYSGMEFAVGTPGSVGGAVRMNAGTKDDWIGSRVVSVTTFAPDQGLKRYAPSDIEWAYRSTSFAPDEIRCARSLSAAKPRNRSSILLVEACSRILKVLQLVLLSMKWGLRGVCVEAHKSRKNMLILL